jgi:hypothetical protein
MEVRLQARSLTTSFLVSLAAVLVYAQLAAAALALAPPGLALAAEMAARAVLIAAAVGIAGALLPLARRPGRRYLAVLAERTWPRLAGSLVLLAERHPELDPGVTSLAAERVEAAVSGCAARKAVLREPRSALGPIALCASLLLGALLFAVGGGRFLDALGEVSGLWGAGPTRIVEVLPGDAELEEGQTLAVSCRLTGRQANWARVTFAGGESSRLQRTGENHWRGSVLPSGSCYRLEVGARGGVRRSQAFNVTVRPRPAVEVVGARYHYPAYTGLRPRTVASRDVDCLQGTRVELTLKSAGRVEAVRLSRGGNAPELSFTRSGAGRWKVSFVVRRVGGYSLLMRPAGGAEREVLRGSITARKDLAPAAAAAARELEDGRLAVDYRLADDYRLGSAKMIFRAGGRTMAFAVPDVAGRRESQGAVLVPREVLAAAGSAGFRYRLVAEDTRAPKPNRGASDELEYRPPQQLAAAGPLLEKPPRRSPGAPSSSSGGGQKVGTTTRPLESLYKPGDEDKKPPETPGEPEKKPGGSDLVAPQGEELEPPKKKPPPKNQKPPESGRENPENPDGGEPGEAPREPQGTARQPAPGGGSTPTPGNEPTSRPGKGPGSEDGTDPGGEKPPTGGETGSRRPPPERVIPGEVNMELKPGEKVDPRLGTPSGLHTTWGRDPKRTSGTSLAPGEVRAPGGAVGPLSPRGGAGRASGPGLGRKAPVAHQYRRYVNEYLRAMSAGS